MRSGHRDRRLALGGLVGLVGVERRVINPDIGERRFPRFPVLLAGTDGPAAGRPCAGSPGDSSLLPVASMRRAVSAGAVITWAAWVLRMCCAICCLLSAGPDAPDPAADAPVTAPVAATVATATAAMARIETGALMRRRPGTRPDIGIFRNLPMGVLLPASNGCVGHHGSRSTEGWASGCQGPA